MDRIKEMTNKYGKPDLERLGLFIEMPYMNGKGYVSPFPKPRSDKGRNIMCEGRKTKNGTQHGYFDTEFRRLFEGEAIPKRKKGDKKSKTISGRPFMPSGITKWHSCPGDYYGTFGGTVEAFSRVAKPKPPYQKQKPNCLTNPGKKGGPGYPHLGLSKDHEHLPDTYGAKLKVKQYGQILGRPMVTVHYPQPYFDNNPFKEEKPGPTYVAPKERPFSIIGTGKWIPTGPTKWQGGCHAGMFSQFPTHMTERDPKKEAKERKERERVSKSLGDKGKFLPQSMALKDMFTSSVLNRNTDICVNSMNYKTYEPVFIKHLVG